MSNSMYNSLLQSSPVANSGAGSIPPANKVRNTQESKNLLINTCSDLVTNMSQLQLWMDDNDAENADRLNKSWANLSNAARGKVTNFTQGAPPSWGLPQTLPVQQTSQS